MSNGANVTGGSTTYRVVRELGARTLRTYAAIREPHELLVLQRFVRTAASLGAVIGEEGLTQVLRDAECLAKNWHPNIARLRYVDVDKDGVSLASELVDGMTLGDLFVASWTAPLLPHAVIVRILVDVLGGLNALHGMRDGTRALGSIHGAVCPSNIVVGKDGVARLVNSVRPRPVLGQAGSEALHYAAPESLDEGGTKDVRSDVYAVGLILWEALVGIVPYEAADPASLLARQRAEEVVMPAVDPASPFAGLGAIAMRAIAFEPSLRYRTCAEMATALRKLAGTEIAAGSVVATTVAELAGDRIRARRVELDPTVAARRARDPKASSTRVPAAASEVLAPMARAEESPDRATIAPAPASSGSMLGAPPAHHPPPAKPALPPALPAKPARPPALPAAGAALPVAPAPIPAVAVATAGDVPPRATESASVVQRAAVVERASVVQRAAVVERASVVQRAAVVSASANAGAAPGSTAGAVVDRASVLQRAAVVERASVIQRSAVVERESATLPAHASSQPYASRALEEAAIAASREVMAPVVARPENELEDWPRITPRNDDSHAASSTPPPRRARARLAVLLLLATAMLVVLVAALRSRKGTEGEAAPQEGAAGGDRPSAESARVADPTVHSDPTATTEAPAPNEPRAPSTPAAQVPTDPTAADTAAATANAPNRTRAPLRPAPPPATSAPSSKTYDPLGI